MTTEVWALTTESGPGPELLRLLFAAARIVAVVGALLLTASCERAEPIAEGEVCRFCAGGRRSGQCSNSTTERCAAGLECHPETSLCERRLEVGEECDHRLCEDGLACDVDNRCNPPAEAGARCGFDEDCAGDLVCLHGGSGSASVGTCAALDGEAGAPCEWAPDYGSGSCSFGGFNTRGCGAGNVCLPGPRSILGQGGAVLEPVEACNRIGFTGCGYRGTCAAAGSAIRGETCVEDDACAGGVCAALPPPRTRLDDLAGYECKECQSCFRGRWPGLCQGSDDLGPRGDCFELRDDPQAAQCGPGLACLGRSCWPLYDVVPGAACEVHVGAGEDSAPPICFAGSTCMDGACQ